MGAYSDNKILVKYLENYRPGTPNRFGAALDVNIHARLLKAFIKQDFEYCLSVWGNYGTAQEISVSKLLE